MRKIELSSRFRRDSRRVTAGGDGAKVMGEIATITATLAADLPLAVRYRDHALAGRWIGFRDCHVRPDLVLIYRKTGTDLLELARIGSHSELF